MSKYTNCNKIGEKIFTYSNGPQFFNLVCGCDWHYRYFISMHILYSLSQGAWLITLFLSTIIMQTFTHEESEQFSAGTGLDCCIFPWILVTKQSDSKR